MWGHAEEDADMTTTLQPIAGRSQYNLWLLSHLYELSVRVYRNADTDRVDARPYQPSSLALLSIRPAHAVGH